MILPYLDEDYEYTVVYSYGLEQQTYMNHVILTHHQDRFWHFECNQFEPFDFYEYPRPMDWNSIIDLLVPKVVGKPVEFHMVKTDHKYDWPNSRDRNYDWFFDKKDNSGFVYVIQAGDTNYYKIGKTKSSSLGRLQTFQSGNPLKLNVVVEIPTENRHALETEIHRWFKPQRLHGEWFELSEEDLEMIKFEKEETL